MIGALSLPRNIAELAVNKDMEFPATPGFGVFSSNCNSGLVSITLTAKNAEIIETMAIPAPIPKDGPCKPRDVFGEGGVGGLTGGGITFVFSKVDSSIQISAILG